MGDGKTVFTYSERYGTILSSVTSVSCEVYRGEEVASKDRSGVHGRNTPYSIPQQDDTVTLDSLYTLNFA